MTMLAQFLAKQGNEVSGSDTAEKFMTDEVLKSARIKVIENFDAKNIPAKTDLIIYSTAYNEKNNAEVAVALRGPKKVMAYAEALSSVFNEKFGIAVVGSHGKTTTSAWLGYVFEKAGMRPSVMTGARVPQFNGNSLTGSSHYLIAELDEYQNKLKYFNPQAVLLNNIEYDHPDFFSSPDDYEQVFIDFIKKIPKKGILIANYDDPKIRKLARVNCRGKVVTYAIDESADFVAYSIKHQNGRQYFKVKMAPDSEEELELSDIELGDFSIGLLGTHNISNALAVIAASVEFEIELWKIRQYLAEFEGTARRMQLMGKFRGVPIIDDYAHHPTEVKATLSALRGAYPGKRLIAVFHPHTYTRTKSLLNDFARSFTDADVAIVLDIYGSAREKHGGVHSKDLVDLIRGQENNEAKKQKSKKALLRPSSGGQAKKQKVEYIGTLTEVEKYLRANISSDDIVILMGAGDVFRIGENLVK